MNRPRDGLNLHTPEPVQPISVQDNDSIPPKLSINTDGSSLQEPSTASTSADSESPKAVPSNVVSRCQAYSCLAVLTCINLLNYMDRYTVSAVLTDIQNYFDPPVSDSLAGLLQTVFICSFMIFAPIFGYLGDRYKRKWIVFFGVLVWIVSVIGSTFVKTHQFAAFAVCRALVGIGEASYATCAVTIISDAFGGNARSRALMLFYFAIPVGGGLAYAIGGTVASATNSWQWGLRVSPLMGVVALLFFVFIQEPEHGAIDGSSGQKTETNYLQDLRELLRCRSYILTTLGFTAVTFSTGIAAWWSPAFIQYSQESFIYQTYSKSYGSLLFGAAIALGGFIGTISGSLTSIFFRRYSKVADPIICGAGLLLCAPSMFLAVVVLEYSINAFWVLVFIAITLLSVNWAITPDILLYVTVPRRRASATAFQILFSHLFGDAAGPYIAGAITDAQTRALAPIDRTNRNHFIAMQRSTFMIVFVMLLGGFFYLACSWYITQDRRKMAEELAASIGKPIPVTAANGGSGKNIKKGIDGAGSTKDGEGVITMDLGTTEGLDNVGYVVDSNDGVIIRTPVNTTTSTAKF